MRLCCWIWPGYCANGVAALRRSMWRCGLRKSIESQSTHFGRIENRLDFTVGLIGTEANCRCYPHGGATRTGQWCTGAAAIEFFKVPARLYLAAPGDGRAPQDAAWEVWRLKAASVSGLT
jgi:hypothetical protein